MNAGDKCRTWGESGTVVGSGYPHLSWGESGAVVHSGYPHLSWGESDTVVGSGCPHLSEVLANRQPLLQTIGAAGEAWGSQGAPPLQARVSIL